MPPTSALPFNVKLSGGLGSQICQQESENMVNGTTDDITGRNKLQLKQ